MCKVIVYKKELVQTLNSKGLQGGVGGGGVCSLAAQPALTAIESVSAGHDWPFDIIGLKRYKEIIS